MKAVQYRLKNQLVLWFLLLGLLPLILVGWISIQLAENTMMQESFAKLSAIQKIHQHRVEEFFRDVFSDVAVLAQSPAILHTLAQAAEIHHTSVEAGKKIGGADWLASMANEHGRWIESYVQSKKYYDLMLIDAKQGDVVYSIRRESDLGENVIHGSLRESGLAKLFKKAQTGIAIQDFEPYSPSNYLYSAFVGVPLKIENQTLGIVVLQFLTTGYDGWLSERSGMGTTGESYLIGKHDGISSFRSVRQIKKSQIGQQRTDPYIELALSGKSGVAHKIGSTQQQELISYAPLRIPGLQWAIISTIGEDEAQELTRRLIMITCAAILIMVAVIIKSVLILSQKITQPLQILNAATKRLAAGAYEARLPVFPQVELKHLTATFNQMAVDIANKSNSLEQAKIYIETIFSTMTVGLIVISEDGLVETANQEATNLLGYTSSGELLGKNILSFFAEENSACKDFDFARQTKGNVPSNLEAKALTKSGAWIDILLSGSILNKATDANTSIVIVFRDISAEKNNREEIKKAYSKLQESEFGLQAILSHAMDAIVSTDSQGRVILFNSAAEKLFGFSREELLGKDIADFIIPEKLRAAHQKALMHCANQGENLPLINRRVELTGVKKNGQPIEVELALTSEFFQGKPRFTAFIRDITQRIELFNSLQTALHTAQQSVQVKSDFLANMSHEIRTPMNAVIGLTHLCLHTELTPQQRDYLDKIHISASALLRIINDILDFSKIEAGKLLVEVMPFQLSHVLHDVSTLITVKAQEKHLEVVFITPSHVIDTLLGDSTRLSQVLTNLTNNAIKFTESGEIILSVKPIEESEDQLVLQFSVRDTGIGMTPDQIGQLFQAFSQADGSTTRKYGGTGLGLTICKRLVELMGGTIWVESALGHGSTFFFTVRFGLPEGARERLLQFPEDLQRKRVLVVDDNQYSQQMLHSALESLSLRVTSVTSGMDGLIELEKMRQENQPFDLLLLDWHMPDLDGTQIFRCLKSLEKPFDLPTIFMVPFFEQANVKRNLGEIQPEAYLDKPVQLSALVNTIMNLFGKGWLLPMVKEKANVQLSANRTMNGERVLLVEDNEINQQVGKELLEMMGVVVEIAHNGREAVQKAAAFKFDLVLMDIQMPEMDGYEATQAIRKLPHGANLPIVAMTANVMANDLARCWEATMNDHIAKPVDPSKLFSALNKWLKPQEMRGFPPTDFISKDDRQTEIFPNLPGIDIQSGMFYAAGSADLLRTLLVKFGETHAGFVVELQQHLAAAEMAQAQRMVHSLKGAAGTIGALRLQILATELESSLVFPPDFVAELNLVLASCRSLVSTEWVEDAEPVIPTNSVIMRETLENLRPHVEKKRPKNCAPILEDLAQMLFPVTMQSDMDKLTKLIKTYKLKEALLVLDSMIAQL